MNDAPQILIDGLLHRLLPFHHEVTLSALKAFDEQAYAIDIWYAAVGAILGSLVLYLIGVWLRRMPAKVSTPEQIARVEKMQKTAREWLPYLLILSPTPIGGMVVLMAGFFNINQWVAALMVVVGEVAWRLSPMA